MNSEYFINWRNFEYGAVELAMLKSKFLNVYFGCSPYHLTNSGMQKIIQQISVMQILPESIALHLKIGEVCTIRPFLLFDQFYFTPSGQTFRKPIPSLWSEYIN